MTPRNLRCARVLLVACCLGFGGATSSTAQRPIAPVRLARIAALAPPRLAGAEPPYLSGATPLRSGEILAMRLPDRRLVVLQRHGATLAASEVSVPAQIAVPIAFTVDASGRVLILDPSANRVFRFVVRSGHALQAAGSFAVEEGASDLCAMGGHVYVYSPVATQPVAAYSDAGVLVRSFGTQFGTGSPRRRESVSRGRLFCAVREDRLVVATNVTGQMRSYDAQGRLAWDRRLKDLRAVQILDNGGGRVSMVGPPEGFHMLLSLTEPQPGRLLVQYGFQPPGQTVGYTTIESRQLDLASGAEVTAQTDLPAGLRSTGADQALSSDPTTGRSALWRLTSPRR